MASILIPPDRSAELPTKEEQQLALWADTGPAGLDLTPHLLLQLEDDLERSRLREAFWISVVVHLMVVILIAMSPKIFGYKGIDLATTADLMKNQNMTYLVPIGSLLDFRRGAPDGGDLDRHVAENFRLQGY